MCVICTISTKRKSSQSSKHCQQQLEPQDRSANHTRVSCTSRGCLDARHSSGGERVSGNRGARTSRRSCPRAPAWAGPGWLRGPTECPGVRAKGRRVQERDRCGWAATSQSRDRSPGAPSSPRGIAGGRSARSDCAPVEGVGKRSQFRKSYEGFSRANFCFFSSLQNRKPAIFFTGQKLHGCLYK